MDNDFFKTYNLVVSKSPVPKCRRPIRPGTAMEIRYLSDDSQEYARSDISKRERSLRLSESETSSSDENIEYDRQMRENSGDWSKQSYSFSKNKNIFGNKKSTGTRQSSQRSSIKEDTNSVSKQLTLLTIIIISGLAFLILAIVKGRAKRDQIQLINNQNSVLVNSIKDIEAKFSNQESNIWNDITSGINEVVSRAPKIPSIILLFANESITMDCLASALAHVSSTVLNSDGPLFLNPEDFGDDPGEIISILNKRIPSTKAVIIRDVLSINAEAIKALHNLCDRINPLVGEAIYIITMQTKNYESSQKKLAFVEQQLYQKFSKNIDEDILRALITRITDGAIIAVQPEENMGRYC